MVDIRNSFSTIHRCFIRILPKVSDIHVQNFTVSRWQSSGVSCRWRAAHSVFSCSVLTFGIMTKFVRLRYIRCWKSGFLPFVRWGGRIYNCAEQRQKHIASATIPYFHFAQCFSFGSMSAKYARTCSGCHASFDMCGTKNAINSSNELYANFPSV